MKVLQETPERLVIGGSTALAWMAGATVKLGLGCLALPLLAFLTYAAQMALTDGDPKPALIAAAIVGVGVLGAFALRPQRTDPARALAPTPGARVTTFDAVAGVVDISGIGTFPLRDVRCAMLDTPEDCGGCNVTLCFHNREAIPLSHVYTPERGRMEEVVERIERFLARLPERRDQPDRGPAPRQPAGPSVYEAQTKEEFERALEALRRETESRHDRGG
jgi:hypothetical protein